MPRKPSPYLRFLSLGIRSAISRIPPPRVLATSSGVKSFLLAALAWCSLSAVFISFSLLVDDGFIPYTPRVAIVTPAAGSGLATVAMDIDAYYSMREKLRQREASAKALAGGPSADILREIRNLRREVAVLAAAVAPNGRPAPPAASSDTAFSFSLAEYEAAARELAAYDGAAIVRPSPAEAVSLIMGPLTPETVSASAAKNPSAAAAHIAIFPEVFARTAGPWGWFAGAVSLIFGPIVIIFIIGTPCVIVLMIAQLTKRKADDLVEQGKKESDRETSMLHAAALERELAADGAPPSHPSV